MQNTIQVLILEKIHTSKLEEEDPVTELNYITKCK